MRIILIKFFSFKPEFFLIFAEIYRLEYKILFSLKFYLFLIKLHKNLKIERIIKALKTKI